VKPAVIQTSLTVKVSIIDQFIMADRASVSQPKFVPPITDRVLPKACSKLRRAALPRDFCVILRHQDTSAARQNIGYNQPTLPGFYPGAGM
jgi:hypothetical protein